MKPAKMTPAQRFAYTVYRTMVDKIRVPEGRAVEICQDYADRLVHAYKHGRNPERYAWTLHMTWSGDQAS